jgi:hypothetical protein
MTADSARVLTEAPRNHLRLLTIDRMNSDSQSVKFLLNYRSPVWSRYSADSSQIQNRITENQSGMRDSQ